MSDALRARQLGFAAKFCIHPEQVEDVNNGFLPTSAEISWAKRVYEVADTLGEGVVRMDGEMIDKPMLEMARSMLRQVEL